MTSSLIPSDVRVVSFLSSDMKSTAMMHRQNVSRMPQFCDIILRSICFALARFEDDEWGAMPIISPISLCESPSSTESLNTFPYCSGSSSMTFSRSSRGISETCAVVSSNAGSGMFSMLDSGIICVLRICLRAMFLTMERIHGSSFVLSRSWSSDEKMTMNESCSRSLAMSWSCT